MTKEGRQIIIHAVKSQPKKSYDLSLLTWE